MPGTDHNVTYRNTVKHWTLYTLDAIESGGEEDGDNPVREAGTHPPDVYEYAGGGGSIVFRNDNEIRSALAEMARLAPFFKNDERPINRKTPGTDWEGPDVEYRYRLTDFGREVLLDLGVPGKLPNRKHFEDSDREMDVEPAHEPGWWRPDHELFGDEWDIRDHDWVGTDHPRVFYKDESAQFFRDRGYGTLGEALADHFEDVTFVLTVGPNRPHDLAYVIRDPFEQVVQIDIYSPMAMHRSEAEIRSNFKQLVRDLKRGLRSANGDDNQQD